MIRRTKTRTGQDGVLWDIADHCDKNQDWFVTRNWRVSDLVGVVGMCAMLVWCEFLVPLDWARMIGGGFRRRVGCESL